MCQKKNRLNAMESQNHFNKRRSSHPKFIPQKLKIVKKLHIEDIHAVYTQLGLSLDLIMSLGILRSNLHYNKKTTCICHLLISITLNKIDFQAKTHTHTQMYRLNIIQSRGE